MAKPTLKNPPLKEAIFEIFWDSKRDSTGFPVDEEFDLAVGKFHERIKERNPIHKRLPGSTNIKVYPQAQHQFWRGELEWPVVQFGPGVLSVHITDKNYIWENTYRPEITNALSLLIESYNNSLKFSKITLRYIDSVDIEGDELSYNEYIEQNFRMFAVSNFAQPGRSIGMNINHLFELEDESKMVINIQTAINNITGKRAIVWITAVEKTAQISNEDVLGWLDFAHHKCSYIFKELLKGEFYDRFR